MGKLKTLEDYLAEHEFLKEAAEFHLQLEKNFANLQPLDLPPKEKVSELIKDGLPLLQQEQFQSQILDVAEKFLPRELAEKFLRQENSDEILERITKIMPEGMSYDNAIDFFKMQLGTWRRFYKEDDKVQVDEAYTNDNRRVTQIKSLNIVFYVIEMTDREIKIKSGFYDTIKTSYKKLFEEPNESPAEEKPVPPEEQIEMLEKAKS